MAVFLPAVASAAPFGYVPNANSNTVSVIDTTSNSVVATVAVGAYPRGVALSPDGSRAYVVNGDSGTVSVISTATSSVVATVGVGEAPNGV
jgi:YVTN family beta-propeller protein